MVHDGVVHGDVVHGDGVVHGDVVVRDDGAGRDAVGNGGEVHGDEVARDGVARMVRHVVAHDGAARGAAASDGVRVVEVGAACRLKYTDVY